MVIQVFTRKKKKKKRRNKNSLVTPQWQQGPCLPISLSFFLESRKLKFKEIIYKREREREKKILKLNLYKDIKKKKQL
jgi:hypothetical protein